MAGPLLCTRCSAPLDAPSATGLCSACAPVSPPADPRTASFPNAAPIAPQRDDTPRGLDEPTPADADPGRDAHAPTLTAADPQAATAPPPALDPRLAAPAAPGYTIQEKIGRGGMGDVYRALEHASDRFVALKFLRDPGDPALLHRFELEFCASANLNHPHAVRVLGHDFQREDPYFVMELMEGGSVAQRLRSAGPLAPADAVALVRKVALAVGALHARPARADAANGIIHRDIKPGNILLTKDGEPKLADFGLVKFLDATVAPTRTNDVLGTAQYMPPEQLNRKNGALDYRADVYGLGATLYHLLTGRPPFTGDTVGEIFHAVLTEPPVPPGALCADVPPGLSALVLKALEKDPGDRYQTVADFVAALDNYPNWVPPPPPPRPRLAQRIGAWVRRNRARVAVATVGTLAAVAIALGLLPREGSEEAHRGRVRAGKTAVLVPERGAPPYLADNWLFNPLPLAESAAAGRAASFESIRPALLAFMRDPGTDAYKLSMDVCVLRSDRADQKAPPNNGELYGGGAALFLCHTRVAAPDGTEVHLFLSANYHECLPPKLVRAGVKAAVELECGLLLAPPGAVPTIHYFPGGDPPIRFQPLDTMPGLWRGFDAEVRPTGVRVLWREAPGADPVELANWGADRATAAYAEARAWVMKHHPALVLPETAWAPRAPFGVHGNPSALAFKNVSISPLN